MIAKVGQGAVAVVFIVSLGVCYCLSVLLLYLDGRKRR